MTNTKTPEEYFQEQSFITSPETSGSDMSPAERAFVQKYLGMDEAAALKKLGVQNPESVMGGMAPDVSQEPKGQESTVTGIEREPDLAEQLREAEDLQLVSFFVGHQEFTVPIITVQEVIRYMAPTRLPAAPSMVAGVINLRGRVTPLVRLRELLNIPSAEENPDKFIVVCRRHGLQIGLMIETVHTMYRVQQESIDWAVESHLGAGVDFISGLMKSDDKLIGIISVDHIVDSVLQL